MSTTLGSKVRITVHKQRLYTWELALRSYVMAGYLLLSQNQLDMHDEVREREVEMAEDKTRGDSFISTFKKKGK